MVSLILANATGSVNTPCINDKRQHLYSTKNIFYMGSVSSWGHIFQRIFPNCFSLKIHFDTNYFNKMQNVPVNVSLCAFFRGRLALYSSNYTIIPSSILQ